MNKIKKTISDKTVGRYFELITCYPEEENFIAEVVNVKSLDKDRKKDYEQAMNQYKSMIESRKKLPDIDIYMIRKTYEEIEELYKSIDNKLKVFMVGVETDIMKAETRTLPSKSINQKPEPDYNKIYEGKLESIRTALDIAKGDGSCGEEKAGRGVNYKKGENALLKEYGCRNGANCDNCCQYDGRSGNNGNDCELKIECLRAKTCLQGGEEGSSADISCTELCTNVGTLSLEETVKKCEEARASKKTKARGSKNSLEESTEEKIMRSLAELEGAVRHPR